MNFININFGCAFNTFETLNERIPQFEKFLQNNIDENTIINIQECRQLVCKERGKTNDPMEIVRNIPNVSISSCQYNNENNFNLITIVPKKYSIIGSTRIKMDPENMEKFSRSVLHTKIQDKQGNIFSVLNTHFGIKENDRNVQVQGLKKVLENEENPWILSGDFNWTAYMENQSGVFSEVKKMPIYREIFQCAENSVGEKIGFSMNHEGKKYDLSGTFVGFDNDFFQPESYQKLSSLQEVFFKGFDCEDSFCIGPFHPDINIFRKEMCTDHIPIKTIFK